MVRKCEFQKKETVKFMGVESIPQISLHRFLSLNRIFETNKFLSKNLNNFTNPKKTNNYILKFHNN